MEEKKEIKTARKREREREREIERRKEKQIIYSKPFA